MALVFMGRKLIARRRGDVNRDVSGREKRLHDQRGDGGDKGAHNRPFGRFGLSFLDIPGSRDDHRKGAEVGDARQDAHASSNGRIKTGCLSEKDAAAIEKVSGPE